MNDITERLRDDFLRGEITLWNILPEAASEIERLRAERLKLDRRIHNQRVALRQTWEIVEMRRKWLGSDTARRMYASLLKRYKAMKSGLQ